MIPISMKGARFGLALLGAAALLAPGAAQAAQPAAPGSDDALARNLKIIADSPHNIGALIGAGQATLELGDPKAALGFFARAEQEAPRDGWVKKWMGSALVQLEQPAAALKFFHDAVSLGVPEASVAGDRGLAWDISGDPRRAQRDYRLALSRGPDPEVTRRLALSLAISGEREPALRLLQAQLQQRDRAAMRTRALVLALTGDRQGADRAVEAELPGPQAAALEPFLARLPSLSLADRALAVHLGHFPTNGGTGSPPSVAYARNDPPRGLPAGYAAAPARSAPAAQPQESETSLDAEESDDDAPGFGQSVARGAPTSAGRRIPGAQSETTASRQEPVRGTRSASILPLRSQWEWSRGEQWSTRQPSNEPVQRPQTAAPAVPQTARPAPQPVQIADAGDDVPPPVRRPVTQPARQQHVERVPLAAPAPAEPRNRLAEMAEELDRLEAQQKARRAAEAASSSAAKPAASRTRTAAAEPQRKPKKAPPAPREPVRHWVQVAHAGDPDALPQVLARLKQKAPKLFAGRSVWTASSRATNRLLVGPFRSDREAEAFADRLAKENVEGFAWTNDPGEKVEKLAAR